MTSRKMSTFQVLSWFKEVSLDCGKYVWTRTRDSMWLSFFKSIDHLRAVTGFDSQL